MELVDSRCKAATGESLHSFIRWLVRADSSLADVFMWCLDHALDQRAMSTRDPAKSCAAPDRYCLPLSGPRYSLLQASTQQGSRVQVSTGREMKLLT